MDKRYAVGHVGPILEPNFDRVVRALTDADLEDEILSGRGEADYRSALVAEHERRARAGSPVSS